MVLKFLTPLFSSLRKPNYHPEEGVYKAGEIYAFKTRPFYDFDKKETGRYGVVKILGIKPTPVDITSEESLVCFTPLDGVFSEIPTPMQVAALPVLRLNRFGFSNSSAARRIRQDTQNTLLDFTFITLIDLTGEEQSVLESVNSWSGLGAANTDVELEWRWQNARDQLIADAARDEEEQLKKQEEIKAKQAANRTWESFAGGENFTIWSSELPQSIIQELENLYSQAATSLKEFGAKPKRANVRTTLRSLVEEINRLNLASDVFIETLHREHLCERIEDLAHLANQPKLIDEIDDWRDW